MGGSLLVYRMCDTFRKEEGLGSLTREGHNVFASPAGNKRSCCEKDDPTLWPCTALCLTEASAATPRHAVCASVMAEQEEACCRRGLCWEVAIVAMQIMSSCTVGHVGFGFHV